MGCGVYLGGCNEENGLEQLAGRMQRIVHTLDQTKDKITAPNRLQSSQQLSLTDQSPSASLQSTREQSQQTTSSVEKTSPPIDSVEYVLQSGDAAERFTELVAKHGKVTKELHALITHNAKMKVAMASMRIQYSQTSQLAHERSERTGIGSLLRGNV